MQLSASYVGEKDRYRQITAGIMLMGYLPPYVNNIAINMFTMLANGCIGWGQRGDCNDTTTTAVPPSSSYADTTIYWHKIELCNTLIFTFIIIEQVPYKAHAWHDGTDDDAPNDKEKKTDNARWDGGFFSSAQHDNTVAAAANSLEDDERVYLVMHSVFPTDESTYIIRNELI